MLNDSELDVSNSTITCVQFIIQPEPRTVETDIRFGLEGVLLPAIGIVGIVGKYIIFTFNDVSLILSLMR